MSDCRERLFNYAKMLNCVRNETGKNQREISEMLNCTEVHISNVKNSKVSMPVPKILELINRFHLCLDEFVSDGYRTDRQPVYEDKMLFGRLRQDELLFLGECLQLYRERKTGSDEEPGKKAKNYERYVGKNISRIRKEKGISMKQIAEELSIREESYRNIEGGTFGTTMDNYILIAKKLEVPVSMLFMDVLSNKESVAGYGIWRFFEGMDEDEKNRAIGAVEKLVDIMVEAREGKESGSKNFLLTEQLIRSSI